MLKVALIGAGGKMGLRLTHNLKNSNYDMSYVEISPAGIEKLKEKGASVTPQQECVPDADIVILAVPDVALEKVSAGTIPFMKSGSLAVTLDPAAALAGKLFYRSDVGCFITHPTHPSIFNWEPVEENMKDHFGGSRGKTINCLCTDEGQCRRLSERRRTCMHVLCSSFKVSQDHRRTDGTAGTCPG